MSFKVKKIRKTKHIRYKRTAKQVAKRHAKKLKGKFKFKNVVLVLSALIVIVFAIGIFKAFMFIKELSFTDVLLALLNRPVQTDEYNHTNILLLGKGGGNHDGANLTDSIMVASFDMTKKTVGILSIPRDLWVETEEVGDARINKIVELSLDQGHTEEYGLEVMKSELEEILDIEIHYHALVDFAGFEEVIDDIGGIEIDVPETLYDPFYPKDGTYEYEPFYIKEGKQELDGKKTLKYVRSRKTTSDFNRARRQQDVLGAVKQKLISTNVLFSKTKLKNLYQTYEKNIKTDLRIYEFIYLGRQAPKFSTENVAHSVINDDPYEAGGLLYTPEREFFGGAFVLIPRTNTWEELQRFADLILYQTEIFIEKTPIHMLNGTKTPNLAFDGLTFIERYGFDVVRYGNSEEKVKQTQIYYRAVAEGTETLKELEKIFEAELISAEGTEYGEESFSTQAKIIIIVGEDFKQFKTENSQLFYSL